MDFTAPPALGDNTLEFLLTGLADFHARAIVEQHIELNNILDGFSTHQRMHAAGIVADHAAECNMRVRRGVGRES
jgi:hypothetical protein